MTNNKYTIEWQCIRIILKKIKNIDSKIKVAETIGDYFVKTKNDSIRSLVNWIDGIAIAYKNTEYYAKFMELKEKFKDFKFEEQKVSTVNEILNFQVENKKIFEEVLKDNLNRSNKWLKSFYNHRNLNLFIDNLYKAYPSNEELYQENLRLRKEAEGKKSTWKFLY